MEENQESIDERCQERDLLRRVNRHLRVLIECNQAIVHINEEQLLLQEICRIITDTGGYIFAWVGFAVEDEKKSIHPVAFAGREEGFLKAINITWADTEFGRGPTGTAIRTGKPFVSRNIAEDERFALWRDEALKRGYKAEIGIPLYCEDLICGGALNIYSAEQDVFDTEEVKLLMELGRDLGYGIMAIRQRKELERSEEKIFLTNERLNYLLSSTTAVIYSSKTSDDYGATYISENVFRLTGYKSSEFMEKSSFWFDHINPEDQPRIEKEVATIFDKDFHAYEYRFQRKDGTYIWVRDEMRLVRDNKGKPLEIVGFWTDINEHKKLDDKLTEECSFRQSVIENAAEGIAVCHETSVFPFVNFTVWNRRMEEITGYTIEEINRLGWYQSVYPDPKLQEEAKERMRRMRQGDNIITEEWLITRKDGQKRTITISTSVLTTADNVVHVLALMSDVTSHKMAGADNLAEDISKAVHEVSNSLMVISGNAQLCFLENLQNKIIENNLKIVLQQCERAKKTLEELALSAKGKGDPRKLL